jgi:lipopolysaccharide/colanic/teichoic acid biosynthesis glycosyltransferase
MDFISRGSRLILKNVIDYSVTILCLIVLTPVILTLVIAIRINAKGPVIYSQKRVGKGGKAFNIYKFRSMYLGTEAGLPLLCGKKDKRLTPVGRLMRKHKLDEIPNFINVLKGEMSIIGPRPEQQYFINQIIALKPEYTLLHSIKPGITSWGQVKYGYASNVDEMIHRLEYDLFYLNNRSLWFDLKIAVYTIGIVIKGEGV